MRKLLSAAAAAALVTAIVAVPGEASRTAGTSKPPRLDGSFNVTGAVRGNDIGIPAGSPVHDTFAFKSTCGRGACKKVGLTRDAGGRDVKSTLHMTKPGVYEGNEGPEPYTCVNPIGQPGQFTGHTKIKVTKAKSGKATKIAGQTHQTFTGCKETYEDVDFKGTKVQG